MTRGEQIAFAQKWVAFVETVYIGSDSELYTLLQRVGEIDPDLRNALSVAIDNARRNLQQLVQEDLGINDQTWHQAVENELGET